MNLALWIVTGLLALVFLTAALNKLFLSKEKLAAAPGGAWSEDFSRGALATIATLEILGVAGLVLPAVLDIAPVLVPLAAMGLGLVMVGAIITRLRRHEGWGILLNVPISPWPRSWHGAASAPSPSDRIGPTHMRSRALVLGGGGVAGISWMLGVIDGLRRHGVDLAAADLIVGTSAGACVGAVAATDALAPAVALQRHAQTSEIVVPFDGEAYIATVSRLAADAPDPQTALSRIANMAPLGPTVSEAERRAVIAARLPIHDWPQRRLVVSAVDARAGELVTFDRDSGVGLLDAVTASCALPGVWPTITIAGRRYVDGGIRSPTNADLADGHDVVVILVPLPTTGYAGEKLDYERAALEPSDIHVIAADEASLAAIGPNPLDPARRAVALDAGGAQAERELDAVAAKWSAPTG